MSGSSFFLWKKVYDVYYVRKEIIMSLRLQIVHVSVGVYMLSSTLPFSDQSGYYREYYPCFKHTFGVL